EHRKPEPHSLKPDQPVPPRQGEHMNHPRLVMSPRYALAVALLAALTLLPPSQARAQLSSASNSTAGATCSGGSNGDGFCGNAVGFSTPNNGSTFTSRYAWNINADVGVFSTRDTSSNAQHNVSFNATAPGG